MADSTPAAPHGRVLLIDDDRVFGLWATKVLESRGFAIQHVLDPMSGIKHIESEPWDIVIDGTDNFPVRYLVNDVCQWLEKPLVYGSIYQWDGQNTVFMPGQDAPCYRCQ